MRSIVSISLLGLALAILRAGSSMAEERPNVLFMIADDLTRTLGCYDYPAAITPNIDGLAERGMLFERAYCQFPHCNPSRSSLLTGLRPNTTRVTNNEDNLYVNIPGIMTMPHYFREQGYATARCGKIFHLGVPSGLESMDDPNGWDFGTPFRDERPFPKARESAVNVKVGKKEGIAWTETLGNDDDLVDGNFAKTAIEWLESRDKNKPFFLAVGFHRPHLPLVAPAKYFDLHPMESITIRPEPSDDEIDIPLPARNGSVPGYAVKTNLDQRRAAIRGYLAAVSFVDAQVGRLLNALEKNSLSKNTIVVFTGDHGWHLGEHGLWHKRSLFEESAGVPLIIHSPKAAAHGQRTQSLAELLDLYPTLCELTGVPTPEALQGKSLVTVLNEPSARVHDYAFTQARRGPQAEYWGRSVRTDRYRCTEWDEGKNGIELYDHESDPNEFKNLATDPHYAGTLRELRAVLAKELPPILP